MQSFFVVITGAPGTGKTTIVKRLVDELSIAKHRISGFLTEEVRNTNGNRIGFDVVSLDATNRGILARNNQTSSYSKYKVGNYSVDTSSLDKFLQPIYEGLSCTDILVVDEVGKMELKSVAFTNFINRMIGTPKDDKYSYKVIIVTVPIVTSIPLVEKIKSLRNSKLFTVTKQNRIGIYDEIKTAVTYYVTEAESKDED